jgi:hypothetical protein
LLYVSECKFRQRAGERIDLSIVLMVWARFLDLNQGNYFKKFTEYTIKPIIITNAKFTSQAIRYSNGMGIELLGWNYPKNRGLERIIENKKLYPITILPSLTNYLMGIFSSQKMMLVKDILNLDLKIFSKKTKIKESKILPLVEEAKILLRD